MGESIIIEDEFFETHAKIAPRVEETDGNPIFKIDRQILQIKNGG